MSAILLLPGISLHAQQQSVQSVLDAEIRGARAYEMNDVEGVRHFLADDYTLTNSKGDVTGKQDDLDDFLKHRINYTKFKNQNMKVRLYPGTAVVTGQTVLEATAGAKPVSGTFQFTDTLVFLHGRWLIVASHATRLEGRGTLTAK